MNSAGGGRVEPDVVVKLGTTAEHEEMIDDLYICIYTISRAFYIKVHVLRTYTYIQGDYSFSHGDLFFFFFIVKMYV